MRFSVMSVLTLSIVCAYGYENSSPFFLYSTSKLDAPSIPGVASAATIQSSLIEAIRSCPTKDYLVVLQPGVSAHDFSCPRNAPLLNERLSNTENGRTSIQVRDVMDVVDTSSIVSGLKEFCNASPQHIDSQGLVIPELDNMSNSHIIFTKLPPLSEDLNDQERHVVLLQHDEFVAALIDKYFGGKDYTLIYATSSKYAARNAFRAPESEEYQAEIPLTDVMHSGELRRSLARRQDGSSSNQTVVDGPLFHKYQFLSPGIFMGGFAILIMVSILYVGVSALASLQVTYAAFDKEQGQLAAKKQ